MTDTKESEEKKDEERFVETLKRMHKMPPEPQRQARKVPPKSNIKITCHPAFRMIERKSLPNELQAGIVGAGDIYIEVFSATSDDNVTARRNVASDDCTPRGADNN